MLLWDLRWSPRRTALMGLLLATLTIANEQTVLQPTQFPIDSPNHLPSTSSPPPITLQTLQEALHTLQSSYFTLWLGKYTTAIDWTSALTTTHLVATLDTLSRSTAYNVSYSPSLHPDLLPPSHFEEKIPTTTEIDRDIETYTAHILALYYTQPTFSLRLQAHDDMLWVSLSYLSTVSFLSKHSSRHHGANDTWHATQFTPSFVHRAHGFHISGWASNHSRNVCDERDDTVWSYNQGILLSGLRGLWDVTGEEKYLLEGHDLVQSVIRATHGGALGKGGILTEREVEGEGGRDDRKKERDGWNDRMQTLKDTITHHRTACSSYTPFVASNALAALSTRDEKGRFGMWWGAPFHPSNPSSSNPSSSSFPSSSSPSSDPNDRGLGRTLETQGSGLAVVRAGWEFGRLYPVRSTE
ncbi:hypothetical protein GRF29_8g233318 [Pseudopithomyces chartarum]|uniref:Uncharacterized protein n=1 Tax=Pseudopithomyces chartarum TaxID=1892770 RepID=A0AAN6M497_9PLEO|nr:hypothetical protein GRF29_8g233318 [Pseudopithomyces chartarum]